MATLLGLLLVVTFIANFLVTVVPNQMQVNDLNHVVTVEDQLGRLGALLASSGIGGVPGQQVVQPIELGSAGVAPWAAPDGASVGGGRIGANLSLTYGLLGLAVYSPPVGAPQGGPALPPGCTWNSVAHQGISCTGGLSKLQYNFSGNGKTFIVSAGGGVGLYALNFSTNNSNIQVSATGGANCDILIVGSNDTITFAMTGGASMNVTIVGNNDYFDPGDTGGATVIVYIYGNSDSVYESTTGGAQVTVIVYGSADSYVGNSTGGGTYTAFVNGFNSTDPASSVCPYGNLSATDTLGGSSSGGTTRTADYNNTNYTGTYTEGGWTARAQHVRPSLCPFFARQPLSFATPALSGSGLTVHLANTYFAPGEVAYEAGAVVYAQYGAYPVLVDPPSISLTLVGGVGGHVTAASIWLPFFSSLVGSASGTGTDTVGARLTQAPTAYVFNNASPTFAINPAVPVVITLQTPYAGAWAAYLQSHLAFAGLWTCSPTPICTGTYTPGATMGTVRISIPATYLTQLSVGYATFALAVS